MSTDHLLPTKHKDENNGYTELEEKTAQEPSYIQRSKDEESLELAVIKNETIEVTTELIIAILAWTNAAVLHTTLKSTCYVPEWNNVQNGWLMFLISLLLAITIIMIPLCWIDVESDEFKKQIIAEHHDLNDHETKHPFFAKVEYLLQAAIGFVVSMTLRDVAMLTFSLNVIQQSNMDSAAYILYAVLWTFIGVWITLRVTNKLNRLKKYLLESGALDTEHDAITNKNNVLLHFAIKQRYTSLVVLTITYVISWSWRNAIDSFVLAMYGGTKLNTVQIWVYCVIITATVSFFVALSEHFYCLYPRDAPSQALYVRSKTVQETNQLISESCKFVVGFAWFDAIQVSVYSSATESVAFNVFVLYWLVALTLIFVSIYATHKFNEQKLKEKMKEIGVIEWVTRTKRTLLRIVSKKHSDELDHDETDEVGYVQYEVPRICSTFAVTSITLTFASWSISGAVFIAVAVVYTVLAMHDEVSQYTVAFGYDRTTIGLWIQWLFVTVILCITALIMLYLKRIISVFRNERKVATDQVIKEAT